jgi:hypothetical protein
MADASQPASARVSAAKTALELGLRGLEVEELEIKLEALERKAV